MRISCLAFARICDPRGRYCLLVNSGRLKHNGLRELTPVGGGLQPEPSSRAQLVRWGATSFKDGDLRFRILDGQVSKVVDWFEQRTGRETTVMRELEEELVDQTGTLLPVHLRSVTEQFLYLRRHDARTLRPSPEKQTAYLVEVYRVTLGAAAMHRLLLAAAIERPQVYFATGHELEAGVASDGTRIGEISRLIL